MRTLILSAVAATLMMLSAGVEAITCTSIYTVVSGDSCWAIMTSHNISQTQFTALNPTLNCNPLAIGAQVCLASGSPEGCKSYYEVKSNDICESISGKFKLSTSKLISDNPGIDCSDLQPGQVLCINYGGGTLPRIPIPDFKCTVPGTFAITFDDGPYLYTNGLLDFLKKNNLKSTFFLNGNNYGLIYNFNSTVRRMYNEGHQICHHTWSHPDITTLTLAKLQKEITQLEVAFKAILGVVPTCFRPPYGNVNLMSLQYLFTKGYRVHVWDVDDSDSLTDKPTTLKQDQNNFISSLKAAGINPKTDGHIGLGHDPHKVTAQQYAPWVYPYVQKLGYQTLTVGECLGIPKSQWYRS